MVVTDKQIYQVKFIHKSNPKITQGAAVIANSYDQARDIFKDSGIEFERITAISEIASSFLTDEIEVTCTETTKPVRAKKDKE